MVADTYDSTLGIILEGTGNNNNTWGAILNNSGLSPIAQAIGGINPITNTSGTVDLSTVVPPAGKRLDINMIQQATGALVGDLTIQVLNKEKTWWFWNNTTNAFNMYVKVPSGVARTTPSAPGGLVQIPQGCIVGVICDGAGNLMRTDDREIGAFSITGKAVAGPGEILCNGASVLRASFPDLFGKIGVVWGSVDGTHFTVPNLTDTNRFLRAGGGSGPAVGTYQANQNLAHSHTITGSPTVTSLTTDSQGTHSHTANVTDPGHSHTVGGATQTGLNAGSFSGGNGLTNPGSTGGSATGITVGIVSNGAHTHTVTGTLGAGTLGTASSGGTEARPEAAAVLMCVRY